MKTTKLIAALAVLTIPAIVSAQAAPMQHAESSGWKELDAFHKILAEAWHPAAQGDTKIARAKATELVEAARVWRRSKAPASCTGEAVRTGMTRMATELDWFADAVKRESSDDAVKVTLKTVHDTFEGFAEACMKHGAPAPPKPPV
jgi:soluble cytochrome b562